VNGIAVEIDTLALEKIDRIFVVEVMLNVKITKIELPNEAAIGFEIR
jgi:hypothetical protein